jgi:Ca2+-transporting ATPase
MSLKPRPPNERILMRRHWVEIGLYGIVMALAVLVAMAISLVYLGFDRQQAVTVSFCTLALAQLWHAFNMRGDLGRIIDNEITRNIWIWLALVLCLFLVIAAVYIPVLSDVMQLSDPGIAGWLVIAAGSLVPLAAAPVVRHIASSDAVIKLREYTN